MLRQRNYCHDYSSHKGQSLAPPPPPGVGGESANMAPGPPEEPCSNPQISLVELHHKCKSKAKHPQTGDQTNDRPDNKEHVIHNYNINIQKLICQTLAQF